MWVSRWKLESWKTSQKKSISDSFLDSSYSFKIFPFLFAFHVFLMFFLIFSLFPFPIRIVFFLSTSTDSTYNRSIRFFYTSLFFHSSLSLIRNFSLSSLPSISYFPFTLSFQSSILLVYNFFLPALCRTFVSTRSFVRTFCRMYLLRLS